MRSCRSTTTILHLLYFDDTNLSYSILIYGEKSMRDVVVILVRKIFLISFLRKRKKSAFKSQDQAIIASAVRAVLGSMTYVCLM